jgi:hypothetical protein
MKCRGSDNQVYRHGAGHRAGGLIQQKLGLAVARNRISYCDHQRDDRSSIADRSIKSAIGLRRTGVR